MSVSVSRISLTSLCKYVSIPWYFQVAEPERNTFYAHPGKILKTILSFAFKIGATLKGKNLFPMSKLFPLRVALKV